MENQIKKLESYALSNHDILRITNNKCNVLTYDELTKFPTLDNALGKNGSMVILYGNDQMGHWCTVNKIKDDLVEFFDPYSVKPDKEFNWIRDDYKRYPFLSKLMKESPYRLSYNHYKFQKFADGINTCGRYCALRVLLKNLSLEQFKKVLTNPKYDSDFLVTALTELFI